MSTCPHSPDSPRAATPQTRISKHPTLQHRSPHHKSPHHKSRHHQSPQQPTTFPFLLLRLTITDDELCPVMNNSPSSPCIFPTHPSILPFPHIPSFPSPPPSPILLILLRIPLTPLPALTKDEIFVRGKVARHRYSVDTTTLHITPSAVAVDYARRTNSASRIRPLYAAPASELPDVPVKNVELYTVHEEEEEDADDEEEEDREEYEGVVEKYDEDEGYGGKKLVVVVAEKEVEVEEDSVIADDKDYRYLEDDSEYLEGEELEDLEVSLLETFRTFLYFLLFHGEAS
ncbi:hypothetical protein BZA05DRAFT_458834 [Tricharina praecox]|uniref:uncharacterized protein n=1 Tax=Tricharina praecox TaxID=43433 RepID=UPI00222077F5|nr:uncharacterized protein BZA05DRAFT_458834 [Tricharina praecox]KAI5845454.1 hypothetical protein BZA05DRAFT_458834 [Tricharina praecox]